MSEQERIPRVFELAEGHELRCEIDLGKTVTIQVFFFSLIDSEKRKRKRLSLRELIDSC